MQREVKFTNGASISFRGSAEIRSLEAAKDDPCLQVYFAAMEHEPMAFSLSRGLHYKPRITPPEN